MLLVSAEVGPFRSIGKQQGVAIDPNVTALVGMNEAGKTVFLKALVKAADVLGVDAFEPVEDYPRRDLPAYLKVHPSNPAPVVTLRFQLTDSEIDEVNAKFGTRVERGFTWAITRHYNNTGSIGIDVDEKPVVAAMAADKSISSDAVAAIKKLDSIASIPEALKAIELTDADKTFVQAVEARLKPIATTNWRNVVRYEVYQWLSVRAPQFLYFGDYEILPSQMNLADLAGRAGNPSLLTNEHRGVLALLRMADIAIEDFANPSGYETLKAKIEGVSIALTDQIMEFWKQNEDLEVEIDIKPDPSDQPPFNNGPNLYIRIKNRRHRGVSTPFKHRSRGFIWVFSFLVWFDDVKHQLAEAKAPNRPLILLLDEPGLSLHALAQNDFLRYIDNLATRHQVIYTTHSPFMIHSDRMHQIRTVEDKKDVGTLISSNLTTSDPRTIFPLQAALGWTVAQNLFVSERNLLVEGPSELIYLQLASAALESAGRKGLSDRITIVPTGGLDKVVTFIALLGASGLKLAVLHDYRGAPEQKILDLVKDRMISDRAIVTPSHFRDLAKLGQPGPAADTEDLFDVALYVDYFNKAFSKGLGKTGLKLADLPKGDRIVERIERHLAANKIKLRPSGGFNHYLVAVEMSRTPPATFDSDTLSRFEALFITINKLLA